MSVFNACRVLYTQSHKIRRAYICAGREILFCVLRWITYLRDC
jgi:hypothetical protein